MRAASWWERERAASLAMRVCTLVEAADQIITDARDVLDLAPTAATTAGAAAAPRPGTPHQTTRACLKTMAPVTRQGSPPLRPTHSKNKLGVAGADADQNRTPADRRRPLCRRQRLTESCSSPSWS
jgi:hypothetical protein